MRGTPLEGRARAWIAALLLLVPGTGAGQDDLDADTRTEVVHALTRVIEARYVDAPTARRVGRELLQRLESGGYDVYETHPGFASVLTRQLRQTDRHFAVHWSPSPASASADGGHSEEEVAAWAAWARRQNFGFRRVEVLSGNVGYVDLRSFEDVSIGGETAVAAMNLVGHADALIVDVRHNGGGEPNMVQLIVSYLLPAKVHYNSLYWREGDRLEEYRTLEQVRGRRLLDVPVYVLTSPRTGSAAEELAYALQALKRATVVGRTTAGAANPGGQFPLPDGYSVFVSTGQAVNPVTGTNWEGEGVVPDVDVPAPEALDVALRAALRGLLADASPDTRTAIQWALEEVELRLEPHGHSLPDPGSLVGTYGDRRIRRDGDDLTYQRAARAIRPMVPLGEDRFLVEGLEGFRLQFVRDEGGRVTHLRDIWANGHVEANRRE